MENIIKMVFAEAAKSNVDKRKVGCVIMGEKGEIYGVGHNAEVEGMTMHAEIMAISEVSPHTKASIFDGSIRATLYVSHQPCKECAFSILDSGIKNIKVVEEFMKFDTDKIRYDLVPPRTIELLAEVLTFGAKKYKPNNWRNNTDLTRYEGALIRHIQAWRLGEKNDPETGLPHLAHAMCNLTFLMELDNDE